MPLSDSSYTVGETELNEFRENVKLQNDILNNDINRLKPTASFQDIGSLIALIAYFFGILQINKDIFLNYWIPSTLIFLIVIIGRNIFDYYRVKTKPKPNLYQNSKQLTIAYFLSLKLLILNTKYNDIAFSIMWVIGLAVLTYNFFIMHLTINTYIFVAYSLILILSIILLYHNYIQYDFFLWINTKVITPAATFKMLDNKDIQKKMNMLNMEELRHFNKNHIFFILGMTVQNFLIFTVILIIFFTFFQNITERIFLDILILSLFQILTYVILSSFLSYKKISEIHDHQKIILNKITTLFDKPIHNIDRQQFNNAKNYLKLSKLFLGHKQNFAIFFTWVEVIPNGELNIEENYDLLYQELKIPPESAT
jgi:hypothetical protein